MTLPGNRLPSGELQPVWDRHGVKWSWDTERLLLVCEDIAAEQEPVAEPGAIPEDRQPFFAHPPNEHQLAALDDER